MDKNGPYGRDGSSGGLFLKKFVNAPFQAPPSAWSIASIKSIVVHSVHFLVCALVLCTAHPVQAAPLPEEHQETVLFNPPEGWHLADAKALPPSVKVMVVGKGSNVFPPSINLGTENFKGSLKQYLQVIKSINDSHGSEWKDLGNIQTEAGSASLSQVDAKTEWGEVRMMHVILVKDDQAYILTAAALKEEFPKFYKDFFNSMRSIRFDKAPVQQNVEKN